MALAAFQGHLVAGIGKALRLYELGKKQLLRKCENNVSLGENDYGIRALI
jgi:splicing factor 3B subunit 3